MKKYKCLECGTTDKKRFSGQGVTYCDKCILKTSRPINLKLNKRI